MNCANLQELLPLHLYGDLAGDEARAVAQHLQGCEACANEFAALVAVRHALATTPTPEVAVDAAALLAGSAARQTRMWRRLAIGGAAIAAGLLMLVLTRWEVRVGTGELVISWGNPRPVAVAALPPDRESLDEVDTKLRQLDELTRALAAELSDRDGRRVGDIDHLRTRLEALQRQSTDRFAESRRDLDALYTAQFKPVVKGELQ